MFSVSQVDEAEKRVREAGERVREASSREQTLLLQNEKLSLQLEYLRFEPLKAPSALCEGSLVGLCSREARREA